MKKETHIMKRARNSSGFTILELLVVVLIVALLLAVALPAIGKARGDSGVQGSISNLVTLSVAHVLYAADWNGRQVTWAVDDLGAFGSVSGYNQAHGGCSSLFDEGCHPHILWGWGCEGNMWRYVMTFAGHHWAVEPINFDGGLAGFGNFRFPNVRAFHDYVNGRVYEETFYAPNDTVPLDLAAPLFEEPCEFNPEAHPPIEGNPPIWISYVLSPAAMFHPDVMRSNAAGGWQDPWSLDYGFESPGLFQALYPDLKTHMIEHHWVQNPPAECNPFWQGCEPYYFNHGIDSTPVTLFYDGHVRLLPNTEVFAADQQVLKQTGGVDGLWHRGTPFGEDGYFISAGYDGVPLSHHILTTDGILGRDTLAETPPNPLAATWDRPRLTTTRPRLGLAVDHRASFDLILTSPEGDQP